MSCISCVSYIEFHELCCVELIALSCLSCVSSVNFPDLHGLGELLSDDFFSILVMQNVCCGTLVLG